MKSDSRANSAGGVETLSKRPSTAQSAQREAELSAAEKVTKAAKVPPKQRTKEDISILVGFLLSVPKLKKFQPSTAAQVAERVSAIEASPEKFVFMQGEQPNAYYMLVTGKCALYIRDDNEDGLGRETKTLRAKDGVGDNELLEGGVRPWSCKAVELTILLEVEADVFMLVLSGGFIREREEKISFLASLPQFKGMAREVLSRIAHCFHEREFDSKEIVVRQGQPSRHLFVIKSGQVSVFVDPDYDPTVVNSVADADPKNCMQVCLLGAGTFIGDMSLDGSRRAATVIALHAVITYKVRRLEFKRIMPVEILDQMRRVAEEKARVQKEHMNRKATPLRDTILLGKDKIPVPKKLLRGYGLRRLGGLLDFDDGSLEGASEVAPVGKKDQPRIPTITGDSKVPTQRQRLVYNTSLVSGTRLESKAIQQIRVISPIRSMLGQGPVKTTTKQSPRLKTSGVFGTVFTPGRKESVQFTSMSTIPTLPGRSLSVPKTALAPQSPRTPRRPCSPRRAKSEDISAYLTHQVFKSSLVPHNVQRPKTPRARTPAGQTRGSDVPSLNLSSLKKAGSGMVQRVTFPDEKVGRTTSAPSQFGPGPTKRVPPVVICRKSQTIDASYEDNKKNEENMDSAVSPRRSCMHFKPLSFKKKG
ncbi:hypothetical protein BSKO_06179 [Bryopsis sp. KO-2023]|nr:hypothetical protein BSKO_06179 [Bryopsis sp. KO-2023]